MYVEEVEEGGDITHLYKPSNIFVWNLYEIM